MYTKFVYILYMLLMYDKVTLWLDKGFNSYDVNVISNRLTTPRKSEELDTGRVILSGYIQGIKVSFHPTGLSIIGSLPKFLYGDNIHPLTRKTTKEAVHALSEALGFDISRAKVNGFEFGFNFPLKNPVDDYLLRLGELKGLQRYRFSKTTLYYKPKGKRQNKMLCFYDKVAEAKKEGVIIPQGLETANILRYELRFNGRLSSQLHFTNITASTLSDRVFYKNMVGLYQSYYRAIYKQKQTNKNDMDNIKTPSDARDVLLGRLINEGEQGKIEAYIEELKRNKVFGNRIDYSRLKNKLMTAANKAGGHGEDPIIKELNNDIENIGAYID